MAELICPRCGVENPMRAATSGMLASNVNIVSLRCRGCGETSSLLRSFGGYAGFFIAYASCVLGLLIGTIELLAPDDLLLPAIVACLLPLLLLPPLWASFLSISNRQEHATPPGDLTTKKKVGYLLTGVAIVLVMIPTGLLVHWNLRKFARPPSEVASAVAVDLDADARAWRFRRLGGEESALADLEDRVVFLNLWATWCVPCIAEMPSIAALARKLREQDIQFVLVSSEDPNKVRAFAEQSDLDLTFATADSLPAQLRTEGIPATFVLHRGKIVYQHVGAANWDDADFRDWLRELH